MANKRRKLRFLSAHPLEVNLFPSMKNISLINRIMNCIMALVVLYVKVLIYFKI